MRQSGETLYWLSSVTAGVVKRRSEMSALLDDISRITASPISRREAFKLVGGAVGGALIASLGLGRASRGLAAQKRVTCPTGQIVCGTKCCTSTQTCCNGSCCTRSTQTCISGACCASAQVCSGKFCASGQTCCNRACCPAGQCCGSTFKVCCQAGDVCVKSICVRQTPSASKPV